MTKGGELEARWRRHVDAWRASGGTQTAYCKEHGLRSH
ncbi:IS66 family insertion sequence element accessory protein TnpA [Candidatus Accumulibacter propinquus]